MIVHHSPDPYEDGDWCKSNLKQKTQTISLVESSCRTGRRSRVRLPATCMCRGRQKAQRVCHHLSSCRECRSHLWHQPLQSR